MSGSGPPTLVLPYAARIAERGASAGSDRLVSHLGLPTWNVHGAHCPRSVSEALRVPTGEPDATVAVHVALATPRAVSGLPPSLVDWLVGVRAPTAADAVRQGELSGLRLISASDCTAEWLEATVKDIEAVEETWLTSCRQSDPVRVEEFAEALQGLRRVLLSGAVRGLHTTWRRA